MLMRNKQMIIRNNGIKTDTFYIPPFELNQGEIVVICLYNGSHFFETEMFLKDLFTGNKISENVFLSQEMTFVEHFVEPKLRRLFYPITVGEYLRKNANLNNPYASKIYENKWISEKTKVNHLTGTPRKLLSLFATISRTNNIIFDLVALDPKGSEEVYEIAKELVKTGGSAILLDSSKDMMDHCDKYIEVEWIKK